MTISTTQLLDRDSYPRPDSLEAPELFQHFANGSRVPFLTTQADIYELLEEFGSLGRVPEMEGFTLTTTGWAAPLPVQGHPSIAPSRHHERRRVCLTVAVNRAGEVASRLLFADDLDHPLDDPGSAVGSLAVAVLRAGVSVLGDGVAEPLARMLVAELLNDMGEEGQA